MGGAAVRVPWHQARRYAGHGKRRDFVKIYESQDVQTNRNRNLPALLLKARENILK